MHGEKVGGVSCFVQQTHTLSEHYKRIFGNIDCFTMVKPVFSCQRIVSGNEAIVAKILCRTK